MITAKRKSSQKGLLKPFDSEPNIARGNQLFSIGEQKRRFCEAVNCERSEQEGKFLFATIWFPDLGFHLFSIGEQKRRFCEAVNCERSEQEGKFLFATIWFPDLLKPHGTMQGKARRAVVPQHKETKRKRTIHYSHFMVS